MVLLLPKVLGRDPGARESRSGARRSAARRNILKSLLAEQFFSMLLAPAMMIFHSSFVLQTLSGMVVRWDAQERDDRGITFGEAFKRMKWHVAIGLVWGAVILTFAPRFIWWMAPVLIGLLASAPLTVLTSRASRATSCARRATSSRRKRRIRRCELVAIEAVNTPEYHAPDEEFHPVPAHAPLRMEPAPLDRYSLRYAKRPVVPSK